MVDASDRSGYMLLLVVVVIWVAAGELIQVTAARVGALTNPTADMRCRCDQVVETSDHGLGPSKAMLPCCHASMPRPLPAPVTLPMPPAALKAPRLAASTATVYTANWIVAPPARLILPVF